jgi:small subunit ribosomal protein S17
MSTFVGKIFKVTGCNVKVHIPREIVDPKYGKRLKKTTKLLAHDPVGVKEGDTVLVRECPPISKMKRHIVVEVIK